MFARYLCRRDKMLGFVGMRMGFLVVAMGCAASLATAQATSGPAAGAAEVRDGQHDWDTFIGNWKMHLRRRLHPLASSDEWVNFDARSVTRKVWGGRANLDEFEAEGPTGHIEGVTLRLYNPQTHQWSIHWANSAAPTLENPVIGAYKDGRGEFYDQERFQGRAIYVRFVWTNVTQNSGDFEQSFSADGGKTWEANWITTMSRLPDTEPSKIPPVAESRDGQHDFDFEFGSWKAHLKRLVHPLSGSNTWVEYDGTSVVNKVWNGRANLGEFDVKNETGHIEGLSLRLFDPKSHQWSISWANAADGELSSTPMVGGFKNGRGEFFDQELFEGRYIFVRFVFSDITQNSFRLEQAFSEDGGKTWEPNWLVHFTRQEEAPAR
jgi:hypothetical protein